MDKGGSGNSGGGNGGEDSFINITPTGMKHQNNFTTGSHRTISFSRKAQPGVIQFGAARFKSQPDLSRDMLTGDQSSQLWRTKAGAQKSDDLWKAFKSSIDTPDDALTHPFQAARLAALKLTSFRDTGSPAFIKWWPYLKVLLGNFCQIASNLAYDRIGWQLMVKQGTSSGHAPDMSTDEISPSTSPTSSLQNLSISPLQHLSHLQSKLSSSSSDILSSSGNTINNNNNNNNNSHNSILIGLKDQHQNIGNNNNSNSSSSSNNTNNSNSLSSSKDLNNNNNNSNSLSNSKDLNNSGNNNNNSNNNSGFSSSSNSGNSFSYTTQQLFKLGIIGILVDCIQFFNDCYVTKLPKESSSQFRYLIIDTLGILIYSSGNNVHCKLKESGADMKTIISAIGRKAYIKSTKKLNTLQREFQYQLHVLRVIRELIHSNPINAKQFLSLKGFKSVQDFILWCTECFQPESFHFTDDICQELGGGASGGAGGSVIFPDAFSSSKAPTTYDSLNSVLSSLKYTTFSEQSFIKTPTFLKRSKVTQLAQLFSVLQSMTFTAIPFSKISVASGNSSSSSGSLFINQNFSNFSNSLNNWSTTVFINASANNNSSSNNINSSQTLTNDWVAQSSVPTSPLPPTPLQSTIITNSPSPSGSSLNISSTNIGSNNNNNNNNNSSSSSINNSGVISQTNQGSWSNYNSPNNSTTSVITASTTSGSGGGGSSNTVTTANQSGITIGSSSMTSLMSSPLSNSNTVVSPYLPSTSLTSSSSILAHSSTNNHHTSSSGGMSPLLNNSSTNLLFDPDQPKKHVNIYLIEMLLEGLFKENSKDINKPSILLMIKTKYPELQLIVLEYLVKIVLESGEAMDIMRKYFLWDLVLSEYFYDCQYDPEYFEQLDAIQKNRTTYIFNGLRSNTLTVTQFLATYDQIDNFEEIMVLLGFMKNNLNSPAKLVDICQLLINITKSNPKTIRSLISLKIFTQLSSIIEKLIQQPEQQQQDPTAKKARNILLSYLGQLIVNEELSIHALTDKQLIETLFLILKKQELKQYALTQIYHLMKLNPDSEQSLSEMYNYYISQLSKIKDDTTPEYGFDLTLALLDGIRQVIKVNPKKQQLFKKFGVFIKIVNLVNIDGTKERMSTLCHSVLKTVIILMANSSKIKKHFRNHIGYDSLKNIIVKSERSISEKTMNILLDMMVDGDFDREYNYVIQNSDATLLIFQLLQHFPLELQHQILDTFTPIVLKCTTNQSVCCNCHLIYHLLGAINAKQPMEITTKILQLIQYLGYHSVSVRELKKLFGLLKSDDGEHRPPTTSVLLSTLQNIAVSRNPGPQVYFDFDGKDSCINLPTFEKWPFPKGFTFCAWVRIESFVDPTGTPDYKPRLFSFLNDAGNGIEALFIYQQVQVQTVTNGNQVKTVFPSSLAFEERKWYFVTIVYSTNLFSSSEIKIFIDGQQRAKASVKIPIHQGPMNNFKIGNNARCFNEARSNPLYGQMGAFNIFDESLSPSQIQSIYSLGANFNTSFQDVEGISTKNSHTFDQSLTNRLFLNYNCRAIEGDLCLDNTPNIGGDRNYDATLVAINPCVSRDIKDIIYCLGGIKVLFPLIPQLNQTLADPQLDSTSSSKLTIQVLGLFKDMLRGSEANQEEMLRCNGLAVLSYLLQTIPPENLTLGALNIFKDMSNQISEPSLVEEVYSLLLDFRLWIKTRFEVQKSLMVMIKQIIFDKHDQVKDIITVQVMLDIMANFYWYEFAESSAILTSKDILQKRPNQSDITDLRQVIFEIIRQLLRNPTTSDVAAIARYTIYTMDKTQVIEMIEFLIDLLSKSSFQQFFDELEKIGSTDIFLTLMSNKDEAVRGAALQLISKLHLTSHANNQTVSNNKLTLKKKVKSIFQDSIIIARSLHLFPLTEYTYRYLMAFALGFNVEPVNFNITMTLEDLMADHVNIVFPEIIGAILKLLPTAESIILRQLILQNIKVLMGNNAANRTSLLQIDKWPEHLFSVLNDAEIKNDQQYSNVTDLIIDIMKILSIHSLTEAKGYKTLEQILATLRPFAERGVLDYHYLTRTLLSNIVLSIRSEANTTSDKESPLNTRSKKVFDNLIHFLMIVEEFIFYSPLDDVNPLTSSFAIVDLNGLEQFRAAEPAQTPSNLINQQQPGNNGGSPSSPNFVGMASNALNSNTPSYYSKIHLNERNEWVDYQLITELLELVDTLKLSQYSSSEGSYTTALQTGKATQMFTSHQQRIIHRILLESIKECCKRGENIQVLHRNTSRLKNLLEKDLSTKSEDSNLRCLFALSHLIKAMRNCTIDNNMPAHQQKLVVSMKEIIRKTKTGVTNHLVHRHVNTSRHSVSLSDIEHEIAGWVAELSDSTRTTDFSTIVMCHVRWTHVCEYVEEMASQFGNEEKAISLRVEKRKKKRNKNLLIIEEKEAEAFSVAERKADFDLKQVDRLLWNVERERRLALLSELQLVTYETSAQWRRILRSLTNERGPWGTTETVVHWKLDKTENSSRMRYKQKRNYQFDEHANCAIDDDATGGSQFKSSKGIESSDSNNNNDENSKKDSSFSDLKVKPLPSMDNDLVDDWAMVCEYDNLLDDQVVSMSPNHSSSSPSGAANMTLLSNLAKEKIIYSTQCDWVSPMNLKKGRLDISAVHFTFTEEIAESEKESTPNFEPKIKVWNIETVKDIQLRRYLLRGSALEIFMKDQTTSFFNFTKNDRNKVYSKINSVRRTYFRETITNLNPSDTLKKATTEWQQRRMCNFDYLMVLNTIAGRTYNDLTQYPVFPWVIKDYTSPTLDLNNPEIYRDLSKPIGALNEKRLEVFKDRYESFDDPDIPKFFYGSHYSSAGTVLFYLIRMEPFTSMFLQLQGARFDHADRMFDSIEMAWHNTLTSSTDVKELIPEFFYMPEFLNNQNQFNFGVKQNGVPIGDVVLPPWAATPHDFVRINREALESEYVSMHLHEWIDLIFGVKQRGRAAIDAYNVFYYLTYEGSVDIDAIEDETMRKATESQINNFGQTPTQLFSKKSHPQREPLQESQQSMFKSPQNLHAFYLKIAIKPLVYLYIPEQTQPMSYLLSDKVVVIDRSRLVTSHKWFPNNQNEKSPFTFELDPSSGAKRRIGLPFANDVTISQNCFAVTNDGRYVISCGHWDNSFKLSFTDNAKLIQSVIKHKDIVTCLAWSSDGQTLITGSRDTTLMVWNLSSHKSAVPKFENVPTHILYGHDDEVTCVDLNIELDICISGSKDGTCIIHNLRRGEYVRTISLPKQSPVSKCSISNQGHIVIYSQADLVIYLYSINGQLLKSVDTHERLHSIIISRDSEYLISGGDKGTVVLRTLYNLKFAHKLSFDTPINSLAMGSDQKHLMVGLEDGRLLIIAKSKT
ncbi:BEACH domain-containing protein [Heterostelium album PN500]|uniref:BEACH domain-containing protein n=1 Tax=Heterostelium pallidum (strain ATCC 26659 / Pp 5 / PN500) TaxID=670386 RepID=D3BT75_HETP5|nr:BEACH domain-containing protein [Heterostelium album PN500]EFA75292.1 BEACH domain-containing protein [Heterostelium album PN500]|eukprot:XP_020427426.1 BEACH domain-containing protein [Heterostelium album PN500]